MPITCSGTKHAVITPDDNDAFDEIIPPPHQGKRLKSFSGVGTVPDAVIVNHPPPDTDVAEAPSVDAAS
jgi:hypothetical protein